MGMSLTGNEGVAVKNGFPSRGELKIYYMLYTVHKLYLLLTGLSRHFVLLVGSRIVLFLSSFSRIKCRKSHRSVSVYSQWLWNGNENSGQRVFLPPLPPPLALQLLIVAAVTNSLHNQNVLNKVKLTTIANTRPAFISIVSARSKIVSFATFLSFDHEIIA